MNGKYLVIDDDLNLFIVKAFTESMKVAIQNGEILVVDLESMKHVNEHGEHTIQVLETW